MMTHRAVNLTISASTCDVTVIGARQDALGGRLLCKPPFKPDAPWPAEEVAATSVRLTAGALRLFGVVDRLQPETLSEKHTMAKTIQLRAPHSGAEAAGYVDAVKVATACVSGDRPSSVADLNWVDGLRSSPQRLCRVLEVRSLLSCARMIHFNPSQHPPALLVAAWQCQAHLTELR